MIAVQCKAATYNGLEYSCVIWISRFECWGVIDLEQSLLQWTHGMALAASSACFGSEPDPLHPSRLSSPMLHLK